MTPAEHYDEAERLLAGAVQAMQAGVDAGSDRAALIGQQQAELLERRALVHAVAVDRHGPAGRPAHRSPRHPGAPMTDSPSTTTEPRPGDPYPHSLTSPPLAFVLDGRGYAWAEVENPDGERAWTMVASTTANASPEPHIRYVPEVAPADRETSS